MKRLLSLSLLGVAIASPAAAGSAEDDLQAVKRAVMASNAQPPRPLPEDPAQTPEAKPARSPRGEAFWFKVRVVEKANRRAKVSINVPIGLVRALGDDWPVYPPGRCSKRDRCKITIGELLRAVDGGQSLVEIEDEDASVRVWVE